MLIKGVFMNVLLVLMLILVSLASGCSVNRATATIDPTTDMDSIKSLHVVRYSDDEDGTDLMIVEKLKSMDYQVTNGEKKRTDIDANVTYVDKWYWDITMYMLELTVTLQDPKTDYPLASGNSYHTSLTRKSAEEMVDEVLTNIFKGSK